MGPVAVQGPGQGRDLLGGLVLAKDHLGKSVAQMAVVVQVGETHVLERQIDQDLRGLFRAQAALGHFL